MTVILGDLPDGQTFKEIKLPDGRTAKIMNRKVFDRACKAAGLKMKEIIQAAKKS